jgi:uncharacterized tellurite resistance protein B-like protein
MSLNLRSLEKTAITKVLFDIIAVDGDFKVGEAKYMAQLQDVLNISKSEMDAVQNMSVTRALSIINNLTEGDKLLVQVMMLEMMRADGHIDEEEMKIFLVVCAATGMPLPDLE